MFADQLLICICSLKASVHLAKMTAEIEDCSTFLTSPHRILGCRTDVHPGISQSSHRSFLSHTSSLLGYT